MTYWEPMSDEESQGTTTLSRWIDRMKLELLIKFDALALQFKLGALQN